MHKRFGSVFILALAAVATGFGGVINQVGTYGNWATTWTAVNGGNDPSNAVAQTMDFVGDASNPGLYHANNGSYVFFRARVNADTFTTASGSHFILIDVAGYGVTNGIDYAFVWDSKSKEVDKHGLEMAVAGVNGPTWGVSQTADIDGDPSTKAVNDINGLGRTTDGYVRTTDGQSTVNFGNTTFVDFAVSWSYLETYTNLRSNQVWSIALASIENKTDHNAFSTDISGADLTDSITVGWSAATAVPEPVSILMIGVVGGMGIFIRRRIL